MLVTAHICPRRSKGRKTHAHHTALREPAEGTNPFGAVYHPVTTQPITAERAALN